VHCIRVFVLVLLLLVGWRTPSVAQVQPSGSPSRRVTVSELAPPVYPPLARQARMSGEVQIELAIRSDDGVESAKALSGDPILVPSALESARQSAFRCKACEAGSTQYRLTYIFRIVGELDRCCCSGASTRRPVESEVSQSEDRITVTASPGCMCPDACDHDWAREHSRVRSAKCLFLWKCGVGRVSIQ
jgi:Gram-negative bacterial TonB protein C-terminal